MQEEEVAAWVVGMGNDAGGRALAVPPLCHAHASRYRSMSGLWSWAGVGARQRPGPLGGGGGYNG
jgi:hypothetical protein